jgi:glycolate oxidase
MTYMHINSHILSILAAIVGEENLIIEREKIFNYAGDEFVQENIRHFPDAVVKPTSAIQVSSIVKHANSWQVPVTVRGGGTGLCGGCVPAFGGIVLSCEKMNRVLEVDRDNLMGQATPHFRAAQRHLRIDAEKHA